MTKTYTIQERVLKQGPLTLSRLQAVARLAKAIAPDGVGSTGTMAAILDRLTGGDLPAEFFKTILSGPVEEVDWAEADANELAEVVEDFFVLNSKLATKLTRSLSGLLTALAPMTSSVLSAPPSTN